MTLPRDYFRCAARFDFELDGPWCEKRHTCARHQEFTNVTHNNPIHSFCMGKPECGDYIEATHE